MRTRTARLLRAAAIVLPGLALVGALAASASAHSTAKASTQAQGQGDRGVQWA
ncbi:MAG: hypothetical protein ACJ74O_16975 [Frankiaceae bacterium]